MRFDEKFTVKSLEKLSKNEIKAGVIYEDLKQFVLNMLRENNFQVNDLNIMYACHLIEVKILCKKDDFGYKNKLNSPKINVEIKLNNFTIDERICRSIAGLCVELKYLDENNDLKNGAKILYDYLHTFDYYKKKIDGFE